ncbi:MAG TPA: hypothetical protein VHL80_07345 [Polyangia bacterium]|nr:hypothetical protein [Polyangia bacterium]
MSLARGRSFLGLVLGLVGLAGGAGCSAQAPLHLTPKCLFQSDCVGALACVQGYCVAKCQTSKDCNPVGRCITTSEGTTCEAPETATCHYNSQCPAPLICAGDFQCRNQCQTAADCTMGQVCTTTSKLCADPLVDPNYDKATNDFKDASGKGADATFGMGIDKLPVDQTGAGGAAGTTGGAGAGAAGASGATGAAGAATGTDGGVMDAPVEQPGVVIASACPETPQTLFSKIAIGDSNPGYSSGVGVRLPTEMVIFDGFTGLDSSPDGGVDGGGAGGAPAFVNRVDAQHFDLQGKPLGSAQRVNLALPATDKRSSYTLWMLAASAAPTGEVALGYAAGSPDGIALYASFLAAGTLDSVQTVQLQSVGGTKYSDSVHVQWEDGQFVASWVSVTNNALYVNMAKFLKDGTPTGGATSIPTTDPSGQVMGAYDVDMGQVAFSGNTFAIVYETPNFVPGLSYLSGQDGTFLDKLVLPFADNSRNNYTFPYFVAVGSTPQGFVSVYNGYPPGPDGGATLGFQTLATFTSPTGADGGVGTTVPLPGMAALQSWGAGRGSSDALGAGFALLGADGKASFVYFMSDGTRHLGPAQVVQELGAATINDEVSLMNLSGSYALSLYSRAEHLTRMAVSGCPATSN